MEFDEERKDDKEYVLEIVSKQGSLLDLASDRLKNDKEVVMTAIKQDGNALEFASDALKDDKEIVVNAIKDMIDKGIYKCNLWDWLKDQDERLVLDLLFKNYNFIDYGIEIK